MLAHSPLTILVADFRTETYGDDERIGFGGTQIQVLRCTAFPMGCVKAIVKSTIIIKDKDDGNDDS